MAEEKKQEKKTNLFNRAWDKTKQGVDSYKDSTAREWIRDIGDKKIPVVTDAVEDAVGKFGEWTKGGPDYAKGLFKGTSIEKHFKKLEKNSVTNAIGRETNRYVREFLEAVHAQLIDWYRDPMVLCCLVKLLASMGYHEEAWKGIEIKEGTALYDFKAVLVFIRAILGIMISVARGGIKEIAITMFDLMAFLATLVVGAVIIIINTFVEGIGQWAYEELSKTVARITGPEVQGRLGKCLPFDELTGLVLKFFISDYGLIGIFKKHTLDFINRLRKQQEMFSDTEEGFLGKIRDLTYLETMYDLLGELIDALENVEFCVEMDLDARASEELDPDIYRDHTRIPSDRTFTKDGLYKQAEDNIDNNADRVTDGDGEPKANRTVGDLVDDVMKNRAKRARIASDSDVNTFLGSRLGYTDDQIAQQNVDTGHVLDCGKSLTDEQYNILNKIMQNLKK